MSLIFLLALLPLAGCGPDGSVAKTEFGHVLNELTDQNRIVVVCSNGVDPSKITIQWYGCQGPKNTLGSATVYSDQRYSKMPHEYGDNFFRLYYDGKEVALCNTFKHRQLALSPLRVHG